MVSKANLLTIPLELRCLVYSYLLVHESVVNMTSNLLGRPLRDGMIRSCCQIYNEALDYYYANNTFLLSLLRLLESSPKLLQLLSRVQHLQVEIGDLGFLPTDRTFYLHVHTRQRCDWFLKTLRQAKRGQERRNLKTLVAIDRCGTSIVSE